MRLGYMSLFLYIVFMGLRVLGCFCSIVCEWMPRLLMGGHFDKKKNSKKNEQKTKRDPRVVP